MAFRRVVVRHALRNAMINPITVILLQINYLISGVVVVETVFAYPGFGRMMLEAALFKDIALVEVGALVAVGVAVLTQIAGDLAYMLLDPRIRRRVNGEADAVGGRGRKRRLPEERLDRAVVLVEPIGSIILVSSAGEIGFLLLKEGSYGRLTRLAGVAIAQALVLLEQPLHP